METMITETTMLYLYTETPLHAGTGSGLSSIDLPIQRERTTQYPMIQGSGIKGKLRATIEGDRKQLSDEQKKLVDIIFGPSSEDGKGNEHAGALIAGDARILLFPVRSLNGVFAYLTSYDVLSRFKRDIERGQNAPLPWNVPAPIESKALVTTNSDVQSNNALVLEEFSFETQSDPIVDQIASWIAENALPTFGTDTYWSAKVKSSLVILPNDDFRDFALYATEVITRVRISRETKTVESGALWTEEHLPTDTLLYVPIYATNARKNGSTMSAADVLTQVKTIGTEQSSVLQLGGDETVGRGMVRTRWGN
jgi:CRISPR-associated protein Cmr4